jgi:hypothetical protein
MPQLTRITRDPPVMGGTPCIRHARTRAVMPAVVHRGVAEPHELVEKLPRLRAVHDSAEARVLTWDADADVEHDGGQKPSLTLGESPSARRRGPVHRRSSQQLLDDARRPSTAPSASPSG